MWNWDFDKIWDALKRDGPRIWEVKTWIVLALVGVVTATWWLCSLRYVDRIDTQERHIALLQEQLATSTGKTSKEIEALVEDKLKNWTYDGPARWGE